MKEKNILFKIVIAIMSLLFFSLSFCHCIKKETLLENAFLEIEDVSIHLFDFAPRVCGFFAVIELILLLFNGKKSLVGGFILNLAETIIPFPLIVLIDKVFEKIAYDDYSNGWGKIGSTYSLNKMGYCIVCLGLLTCAVYVGEMLNRRKKRKQDHKPNSIVPTINLV